jgi:MFS family permease
MTFVSKQSQTDIVLLLLARGLRGFGDGFVILVLPAYLSALGFSPPQIGITATASLLGSSLLTLAVGFIAPRHALRNLLLAGAVMTMLTGLAFPNIEHFALILIVSFVGTISASDGDRGMLVPLEHAKLTQEAAAEERTKIFARYSLIGTLAAAVGSLAAAVPDVLTGYGITPLFALKLMFYAYAGLGLLTAMLYGALPHDAPQAAEAPPVPLRESRAIVYKLAALFSLDSFAGGFAAQSLLALWLFEQFDMSLAAASVFFFWTGVASAFSFPVAVWIAKRVGLINTMVFTHIPSSLCLIAAAFCSDLTLVLSLLLVRAGLSQMDVPTRSSYVMAVVTPAERTAAASVTAVPRGVASSISPAISGFMLAGAFTGLPFVICGSLKIVYDLALLGLFRKIKPPEERA